MTIHEATEQAYKNGYDAGRRDAMKSIVRCKDCKHNSEKLALRNGGIWCNYWAIGSAPNDFCSHGEPKEGEQ